MREIKGERVPSSVREVSAVLTVVMAPRLYAVGLTVARLTTLAYLPQHRFSFINFVL